MKRIALLVLVSWVLSTVSARSQELDATLRIEVEAAGRPALGAVVSVDGVDYVVGQDGAVEITVPAGVVAIHASLGGFADVEVTVTVRGDERVVVPVRLGPTGVDEEVVVVASTRTGRRIEDQPMRVEVLDREEIEEKMMMTPGDIVMMLNEMGGLRVQSTSPAMGSASLRVQGMRGRYTRFFSDGLPLFGEQPGGIGLLQIPPMDLGQVEVIKGVASALYGAGAMGGVVNLVSREPGATATRELLLNQSARGGAPTLYSGSPAPLASAPARRCWAASTGRWRRMSRATAGPTCRRTSVPSCVRASTGMATVGPRCSPLPG